MYNFNRPDETVLWTSGNSSSTAFCENKPFATAFQF